MASHKSARRGCLASGNRPSRYWRAEGFVQLRSNWKRSAAISVRRRSLCSSLCATGSRAHRDARRSRPYRGITPRPVAFVPSNRERDWIFRLDDPQDRSRTRRQSATHEAAPLTTARVHGRSLGGHLLARLRWRRRFIRTRDLGPCALGAIGGVATVSGFVSTSIRLQKGK